jgi:hypothetical protein
MIERKVDPAYAFDSPHLNSPATPTPVVGESHVYVSFGSQICIEHRARAIEDHLLLAARYDKWLESGGIYRVLLARLSDLDARPASLLDHNCVCSRNRPRKSGF